MVPLPDVAVHRILNVLNVYRGNGPGGPLGLTLSAQELESLRASADLPLTEEHDGHLVVDQAGVVALLLAMFKKQYSATESRLARLEQVFDSAGRSMVEWLATEQPPSGDDDATARNIAALLKEPDSKVDAILRLVKKLGAAECLALVEYAVSAKATGEQYAANSVGGVFFKLAKAAVKRQGAGSQDPTRSSTIATPLLLRAYQTRLITHIVQHPKCLLVLPPGFGKTVIAVRVLEHHARQSGKIALLVVPTNVLAEQHAANVARYAERPHSIRVVQLSAGVCSEGGKPFSLVSSSWSDWAASDKTVFAVITAGMLESGMAPESTNQGLRGFSWTHVGAVAIDEVHNARGDHPMRLVLDRIQECADNTSPIFVLGMTASPFTKPRSTEHAKREIAQLALGRIGPGTRGFGLDHSDEFLVSAAKLEVARVAEHTNPSETRFRARLGESLRGLARILGVLDEVEDGDGPAPVNVASLVRIAGSRARAAKLPTERVIAQATHAIAELVLSARELRGAGMAAGPLGEVLGQLATAASQSPPDDRIEEAYELARQLIEDWVGLEENDEPTMAHIARIVQEQLRSNPASVVMVRTLGRVSARYVHKFLSERHTVKAVLALGLGSGKYDENYSLKSLREARDAVANGAANVIVGTSVLQEGLDLSACDLVLCVSVEAVRSGAQLHQQRGRVRADGGRLIVLAHSDTDASFVACAEAQERSGKRGVAQLIDDQVICSDFSVG